MILFLQLVRSIPEKVVKKRDTKLLLSHELEKTIMAGNPAEALELLQSKTIEEVLLLAA